jgi:hypothetical protein
MHMSKHPMGQQLKFRRGIQTPSKFGHGLIAGDLVNWSTRCLNLGVIHEFDSGKLACDFFVKFCSPY